MSTSVAGLSVAGLCQLPGLHSPLCEPGVVFLEGRGTEGQCSVSVNDPCESPLRITGHHGFNICCELDIRVPGTQWGGVSCQVCPMCAADIRLAGDVLLSPEAF